MDYEKKYKEALERAKKVLLDCTPEERKVVEYIFPSLKESEDEKIRKALIDWFSDTHAADDFKGIAWERIVAWLEKQGEKPNNVYDKGLSEILVRVIRRYINDPNIPYAEREKVSREIIPYVERLEKQGKNNMGISEATKQKLEDNLNKALEKETPDSWSEFLDEQKPAWSEEDSNMLQSILDEYKSMAIEKRNWLKSLRPQHHWKPSKEQIEALTRALSLAKNCGEESAFDLRTLYEQLKKL